jgi:chromosome segregation ATPase
MKLRASVAQWETKHNTATQQIGSLKAQLRDLKKSMGSGRSRKELQREFEVQAMQMKVDLQRQLCEKARTAQQSLTEREEGMRMALVKEHAAATRALTEAHVVETKESAAQLHQAKASLTEECQRVSQTTAHAVSLSEELAKARSQKHAAEHLLAVATTSHAEINAEVVALSNEKKGILLQLKQSADKLKASEAEAATLKEDAKSSGSHITALSNEKRVLQARLEQSEEACKAASEKRSELNAKLEVAAAEQKASVAQVAALQEHMSILQVSIAEQSAQAEGCSALNVTLARQTRDLQARLEQSGEAVTESLALLEQERAARVEAACVHEASLQHAHEAHGVKEKTLHQGKSTCVCVKQSVCMYSFMCCAT